MSEDTKRSGERWLADQAERHAEVERAAAACGLPGAAPWPAADATVRELVSWFERAGAATSTPADTRPVASQVTTELVGRQLARAIAEVGHRAEAAATAPTAGEVARARAEGKL